MAENVIRTFRSVSDRYRHILDTRTDDVLMQAWEGRDWVTILRYDSGANVWSFNTGASVGHIRIEGGHWVFTSAKGYRIIGRPAGLRHSLLDTEVEVSEWWLSRGRLE